MTRKSVHGTQMPPPIVFISPAIIHWVYNKHLQSLTKTPVKFQKDWDKIVGGVALTRYLMSISFCSNLAQK